MLFRMLRRVALASLLGMAALASPAHAEVVATFYAREFGEMFPHAFVVLKGDDNGTPVSANYGFTASNASPAVLFGRVKGVVSNDLNPTYVRKSNAMFSVRLTSAQYRAMMAEVASWRGLKQPSYSLNKANCVHFIGAMARAAGLKTKSDTKFIKKPHGYLTEVKGMNPGVLAPVT